MHQLPTADIVVLVVYLAAVVAFGCWFVRRSRSTEGFMAAGRSLPGWAVGMSIFGTYLSSNTFIGVPGKAFGSNWNSFVFSLSLPIAAPIAVWFFVPFYRRSGEISAYHHLEKRFGTWARVVVMVCYLLTQVVRTGAILLGVAIGLNALIGQNIVALHGLLGLDAGTGWDPSSINMALIIVATGALVTLYTLVGGIEAVIWTDVAQSIVLMIGAVVVASMLLFGIPGGAREVFAIAAEHDKFSLGSFGSSLAESTFWVVLMYGVVMNLNNFGIDQSFVQRYHTARSDREAAKSVWIGGLMYLPVAALFFFIGTSLFAYYEKQPHMLDDVRVAAASEKLAEKRITPDQPGYQRALTDEVAALEPSDLGDNVLPHFIVTKLPKGMAGLLIAAIFAAAMSSIDTSLNSSATIVLSDFHKRFFRPRAGERESMAVLYLSTLLFGALGTGIALSLIGVDSILDAWWYLSGIFAGGMLGLFLLGITSRTARNPAAVTGLIAGLLVTVTVVVLQKPKLPGLPPWPEWIPDSPVHKLLIPVLGSATIVLVSVTIAQLGRFRSRRRARDTSDA